MKVAAGNKDCTHKVNRADKLAENQLAYTIIGKIWNDPNL